MTRRVVLDTNIVVSGLLKPQGLEALVLRLVLSGQLALCTSPAVLEEYQRVLAKPKLKLTAEEIKRALEEILTVGKVVRPAMQLPVPAMTLTIASLSVRRRPERIFWSPVTSNTSRRNGNSPGSSPRVNFYRASFLFRIYNFLSAKKSGFNNSQPQPRAFFCVASVNDLWTTSLIGLSFCRTLNA
jgi:putative PIN family toxin of toxin-antitoxin system